MARLLKERGLRVVFQPIVNMADGGIYAHEALIRGPHGMPLNSPDALLKAARNERLLLQFELACVAVALCRWAELRQPGRLFVNISATALVERVSQGSARPLLDAIERLGLHSRMLTLEITEHEHIADVDALLTVAKQMHGWGISFALDDFGDGRSSLRLWAELTPDIVKIDKYFTRDLGTHAKKHQTLRALMQIADVFGTSLVAEGIETAADLRAVRDLGINFGQGYLLGRPDPEPRVAAEREAIDAIKGQQVSIMPAMRSAASAGRLNDLRVIRSEPITSTTTNEEVLAMFASQPTWMGIVITDRDVPVGLIPREKYVENFAQPFFKEIYGKKPAAIFANMSPRLVEREHSISELMGILTSADQRYLTEGFIVTENGRYVGIGSADQLVRNVTESRIEAARHANPLTFLPGNIPISEHIERLLRSGGSFIACYADLADFKPFNDHYGYWRGDEMIQLVAAVAVAACDPQRDFVGHVGGDDFVLLFQGEDWRERCELMIEDFNSRALALYDDEGRAAGGVRADDRRGDSRFFPFTRLYVGAVRVSSGRFTDAKGVATAAARAKHAAKAAATGIVVH